MSADVFYILKYKKKVFPYNFFHIRYENVVLVLLIPLRRMSFVEFLFLEDSSELQQFHKEQQIESNKFLS